MTGRKTIDRQPGTIPEIRAEGDSLTFRFDIAGARKTARLVIRCDAEGNVWMSIAPAVRSSDR